MGGGGGYDEPARQLQGDPSASLLTTRRESEIDSLARCSINEWSSTTYQSANWIVELVYNSNRYLILALKRCLITDASTSLVWKHALTHHPPLRQQRSFQVLTQLTHSLTRSATHKKEGFILVLLLVLLLLVLLLLLLASRANLCFALFSCVLALFFRRCFVCFPAPSCGTWS